MNYAYRQTALATAIVTAIANPQASAQEIVDQAGEIEEITVTGSRIKRTELTSPSPVTVVNSAQIQEGGFVNLDLLLNELPQIMPSFTSTTNFEGPGTATVDLRGMGPKRTLVLVNGRRFIPTNSDGTVDITGIPTGLVERIEVVTGGASAIYGSDAIAGVVNFILDDDYEGFEVNSSYKTTTSHWDGEIYSVDAKFGTNFADDNGNIVLYAGYSKRSEILQGDRDFSEFTLDDGFVNGVATLVTGGSTNVPATRWALDPSAIPPTIENNINGNPNAITFDNGSPLAWNDPQDRYNYAAPSYMQLPQERIQVHGFANHEIDPLINVSLEASFLNYSSDTQTAPDNGVIRAGNAVDFNFAVNPYLTQESKDIMAASELITDPAFGLPTGDGISRVVLGQQRVTSLGPRQTKFIFQVHRVLAGLNGQISENWRYDAYYSRGKSLTTFRLTNRVDGNKWFQAINATTDPVTGEPVCIDPSGGCEPINIWGAELISEEAADYIRINQNFIDQYEQQTAGISFVGTLPENISFGAGPIGAAYGVEWRDERFSSHPDSSAMIGDANRQATEGNYHVREGFAEIDVPLLNDSPIAETLSVNGALRYSDYNTLGGSPSWQFGAEWSPPFIDGLRFRGGKQRSVRAPNVIELFSPEEAQSGVQFQDPCDAASGLLNTAQQQTFCNAWGAPTGFGQGGGATSSVSVGNPDLDVEKADTWTLGAVYQPTFFSDYLDDVTLTVDYYNIELENAIALFGGGVDNRILSCYFSQDLTSQFCQNVNRDPLGNIQPFPSPFSNVSLRSVEGIDLQTEFNFSLFSVPGRFNVFLLANHQISNGFQGSDVLPFIECAGKFAVPCGSRGNGTSTPEWQTNTRFTWQNDPFSISAHWRWLSSVEDARLERARAFGLPVEPIASRIPDEAKNYAAQHYLNINAVWAYSELLTLRVGFDNIFNNEPPLAGDGQIESNTDPGTYDPIGRQVWANFTLRF